MHSCEETQTANLVSGGSPPSGSSRQAASRDRGAAAGEPRRDRAIRRLDALRLQQLGDELAKDHRLAVGDEVGLSASASLGRDQQALDDVVDVGGVGAVPPAADPGEPARLDRGDELGGSRVVSPRPQTNRGRRTTVSSSGPAAA